MMEDHEGSCATIPIGIEEARRQIEHWRKTRHKMGPMPEALWESAVTLAREHGVAGISRELGVNYESLSRKLALQANDGESEQASTIDFVEFRPGERISPTERAEMMIELADESGAKLAIRQTGRGDFDILGLVETFFRRRG